MFLFLSLLGVKCRRRLEGLAGLGDDHDLH